MLCIPIFLTHRPSWASMSSKITALKIYLFTSSSATTSSTFLAFLVTSSWSSAFRFVLILVGLKGVVLVVLRCPAGMNDVLEQVHEKVNKVVESKM